MSRQERVHKAATKRQRKKAQAYKRFADNIKTCRPVAENIMQYDGTVGDNPHSGYIDPKYVIEMAREISYMKMKCQRAAAIIRQMKKEAKQ